MTVHRLSQACRLLAVGASLLCSSLMAFGQQSFGGTPLMMHEGSLRSLTAVRTVSLDFNPADFLSQDSWSETVQTKPLSVGRVIKHSANFAEAAELVGTIEGRKVYRLEIELEGTPVGCNLYYEDFYIPEGGKLYIYSPEGKQVLGAYTHATHPEHGPFATEPISGNTLILDYEAPATGEMPSIQVQGVGYFYRPALMADGGAERHALIEDSSDPGFGRYCQINANCPEGDLYEAQKASSVAMLMVDGDALGMCSGNLVNNALGDFKPYVMTAGHCASSTEKFGVTSLALSQWIFSFHYEKPRCSSGDYATLQEKSVVGAEMKSFLPVVGYSDGLLLEIKQEIPLDYRVYYSGWDATPTTWQRGASIHHPAGDAAKISIFDGGVKIKRWNIDEGGVDDHLGLDFIKGNTEGGSSGSPLFNADGDQVGTLTGGLVTLCSMDADYGRLNSHFDKYKSKGETWYMAKWLDPNNTGTVKVKGTWRENYQPLDVVPSIIAKIEPTDASKIKISWEPVPQHPQGYAVKYNLYRNGNLLASKSETTHEDVVTGDMKRKGRVTYSVEAVYTVEAGKEEATPLAYYNLYTGQLASRAPLKVTVAKTGTKLKWQMPYNAQVVTKIKNRDKIYPLVAPSGVNKILSAYNILPPTRIYMYDSYRLGQSPFNGQKLYIHQINFIPSQDTPYNADGSIDEKNNISFFVRQKKDGSLIQYFPLDVPKGTAEKAFVDKELFSFQLSMPVEITDAHLLDVGFAFDPSNTKGTICLDANSTDELVAYDGCKLALAYKRNKYRPLTFNIWQEPYSKKRMAYQAVELVISDNPEKQSGVTDTYYTRGTLPVPFPAIKGYKIYRNGKLVKELNPDTFLYEDTEGKTSDDYYVEVVYDYPNELRPTEPVSVADTEVSLYPAHFTTQLQLTDATDVQVVELYNMQGLQVAAFAGAQLMAMDVSALPAGQYIATIRTAEGVQTQKLVK